MADPTEESSAERQSRIRREKREKKILSGANSRLDKITSLSSSSGGGGRPGETDKPTSIPSPSPTFTSAPSTSPAPQQQQQQQQQAADPTHEQLEASMRQLLRSNTPSAATGTPPPAYSQQQQCQSAQEQIQIQRQRQTPRHPQQQQNDSEPQDPMLALLQQMMGAGLPPTADGQAAQPGVGLGAAGFDGLPAGLAALLGGGGGAGGNGIGGVGGISGMPAPFGAGSAPAARSVYIWKIVHAVFALMLGVYILYMYTFSGTLVSRLRVLGFSDSVPAEGRLFWIFVTAELGLQGGRFLLEGGRRSESGMMSTVAGFLPRPWGERVGLVSRYMGIWSTLVQDAFVVVFLLGAAAWWRGDGVAV